MTMLGYIFWGTCIVFVVFGYVLDKKYGTKAPDENNKHMMQQEIAKQTHSNNRPRL